MSKKPLMTVFTNLFVILNFIIVSLLYWQCKQYVTDIIQNAFLIHDGEI